MRFKRLLALLLAAALAVLVGCGSGQQSAARVLLNLLDGKYPNISVELDPDLEADLRQAISQAEAENAGDDDAVIRAALEKLVGSTVTFRNLGDGQQGDTTFDLVFYAGTDPDKAAQAAYSQWNIVFANVPDDGKYGTGLAMVETDNGIWMLVKATVEKAGTEDKAEPATVTGISVSSQPKKTQYNPGEPFDPDGMVITVTYSDGSTKTISSDYSSKGVTWSPAKIDADTTVTITYGGKNATVEVKLITLESIEVSGNYQKEYTVGNSFNPDGMVVTAYYSDDSSDTITSDKYTVKINDSPVSSSSPFATAGDYSLTVTYDNLTSDPVNIHVTDQNGYHEDSSGNYVVTGIDGLQNLFADTTINAASANITLESPVTLDENWKGENIAAFTGELNGNGNTITMKGDRKQGLFNEIGMGGTVENVHLQIDGTIRDDSGTVGGIAGTLRKGTVTGCSVTGGSISSISDYGEIGGVVGVNSGGRVTACYSTSDVNGVGNTGGVVGFNYNGGTVSDCYSTGTVSCGTLGGRTGGVVGKNSLSSSVIGCYHVVGEVSGVFAGGVVGFNSGGSVTACYSTNPVTGSSNGRTGGVVGWNDQGTVRACYWSGNVQTGYGIGYDGPDPGGVPSNENANPVTDGVTWQIAYKDMNDAAPGHYSAPVGDTPPKLNWEK